MAFRCGRVGVALMLALGCGGGTNEAAGDDATGMVPMADVEAQACDLDAPTSC